MALDKHQVQVFLSNEVTKNLIQRMNSALERKAIQIDPFNPSFNASTFQAQKAYEMGFNECARQYLQEIKMLASKYAEIKPENPLEELQASTRKGAYADWG